MIKTLTCIECPKSCRITVDYDGDKINSIMGFQCKKGEAYAREEIVDPKRILTSSVLTEGLELRMVPVRTDKPIPKSKLSAAMAQIKNIRLVSPVRTGDVVCCDFMLGGINLITTRPAK